MEVRTHRVTRSDVGHINSLWIGNTLKWHTNDEMKRGMASNNCFIDNGNARMLPSLELVELGSTSFSACTPVWHSIELYATHSPTVNTDAIDAAPTHFKAVRFFHVVNGLMQKTTISMAEFLANVGPPPTPSGGFTIASTIGSSMFRSRTAYPTEVKKQQAHTSAMENIRALRPKA